MTAHAPHSREALAARFGPRYRWWVLLTVMIGTMAAIMASTIINVAVPDMSEVFGLGQDRAQWLSAGFMAAMTLSMLTTPWLLERYGYRHAYCGAVLLLLVGGVCGGSSLWFGPIIAMRIAEGLAAGIMSPIPAIIILHAFGPGEQGKAMGIFGFGVVLAPAVGPSVGGVLVEWWGWRSIFFVVVPFCLVALFMARRYLPVGAPGGVAVNREGARIDVLGLALLGAALLTLLNGIVALQSGAGITAAALLGACAAAIAVFVLHQRRSAHPLMRLELFAHRPFALGGCVAFIYGMGLFGSTYLVPVFMQVALRLPPSQAGAVLLPAGIALALTIPVGGRLADRWPVNRVIGIGVALLALSFFLMVWVEVATALAVITLLATIGRVGLGLVMPSLNLGSMRGLSNHAIAHASSTINFLRQLGGAVGISLVGSVLEWRLHAEAASPLRAFHETFVLVGAITACAVVAAVRMGAPPQVPVNAPT